MNHEALTTAKEGHAGAKQELSPWVDFALWLAVCAVVTFFYLGWLVPAETLYQSARPDASSAFFAVHPELEEGGFFLDTGAQYLATLADHSLSASLLYGGLGVLSFLLLGCLFRPQRLLEKLLCLCPLVTFVCLVQECWLPVLGFALAWCGCLLVLLLLKPFLKNGNKGPCWLVEGILTLGCCGIVFSHWGLQEASVELSLFFLGMFFLLFYEGEAKKPLCTKCLLLGGGILLLCLGLSVRVSFLTVSETLNVSAERARIYWVIGMNVLGWCLLALKKVKQLSLSGQVERGLTAVLLLGMLGAGGGTFLDNRTQRQEAFILSQVRQAHYVKALAQATSLDKMDYRMACTVRYALYKQNQLLENLFFFPLTQEIAVLPETPFKALEPYYKTMLEMGFVNSAEHFATEALEQVGNAPEVLYDLGVIYTLKAMPEAARVYWGYLAKNSAWSKRAEELIAASHLHPAMREHPAIEPYYTYLFNDNFYFVKDPAEFQMRQSLKKNPTHRMALEYLAAEYLGYRNNEGVAGLLPLFRSLHYTRLPRHIEEALCLIRQDQPALDSAGYSVSPETEARFKRFCELYQQKEKLPTRQLFQALAPLFGDTYWFYQLFALTGKVNIADQEDES